MTQPRQGDLVQRDHDRRRSRTPTSDRSNRSSRSSADDPAGQHQGVAVVADPAHPPGVRHVVAAERGGDRPRPVPDPAPNGHGPRVRARDQGDQQRSAGRSPAGSPCTGTGCPSGRPSRTRTEGNRCVSTWSNRSSRDDDRDPPDDDEPDRRARRELDQRSAPTRRDQQARRHQDRDQEQEQEQQPLEHVEGLLQRRQVLRVVDDDLPVGRRGGRCRAPARASRSPRSASSLVRDLWQRHVTADEVGCDRLDRRQREVHERQRGSGAPCPPRR